MFKNKIRESPKLSKKGNKENKNLSSKEFLKGYDALWKEGPSIKYQNPDAWNRHLSQIINSP